MPTRYGSRPVRLSRQSAEQPAGCGGFGCTGWSYVRAFGFAEAVFSVTNCASCLFYHTVWVLLGRAQIKTCCRRHLDEMLWLYDMLRLHHDRRLFRFVGLSARNEAGECDRLLGVRNAQIRYVRCCNISWCMTATHITAHHPMQGSTAQLLHLQRQQSRTPGRRRRVSRQGSQTDNTKQTPT